MDSIENESKKLSTALNNWDGATAKHVLDEVGSCNWSAVFVNSQKENRYSSQTVLSVEPGEREGTEVVHLDLASSYPNFHFATTVDKACKDK